jgi:hypothetical protein
MYSPKGTPRGAFTTVNSCPRAEDSRRKIASNAARLTGQSQPPGKAIACSASSSAEMGSVRRPARCTRASNASVSWVGVKVTDEVPFMAIFYHR